MGEGKLVSDDITGFDAGAAAEAYIKEHGGGDESSYSPSENSETTTKTTTTSSDSANSFDHRTDEQKSTDSPDTGLVYPNWVYSYGSKSGSGNYNPKIYSNTRSLNSSRASTMYSKQPRDANYSYLRPSFDTNGSRSAYER